MKTPCANRLFHGKYHNRSIRRMKIELESKSGAEARRIKSSDGSRPRRVRDVNANANLKSEQSNIAAGCLASDAVAD